MVITEYEEELLKTIRRLGYNPLSVLASLQELAKINKDVTAVQELEVVLAGLETQIRGTGTGEVLYEKTYLALPAVNEADRDRVLGLFYGSFPKIGGGIKSKTVVLAEDTFYECAAELHNTEEVKVIVQKVGSEWKCVAYKML